MKHQTISFIKSGVRILGYLMMFPVLPVCSITLVASELVGVVEEIGHE
jgi:hypothetical protein